MNIWAIEKDISIKLLLLRVDEDIGLDHFTIPLGSDLNPKEAIRFVDLRIEGLSAYVYCYGQTQGNYGVHLEYPPVAVNRTVNSEIFEELTLERVIEILAVHFNLFEKADT